MVEIDKWMDIFTDKMGRAFGSRIRFIGLQGSYARGEATECSDIDAVVILNEVSFSDLEIYDKACAGLPARDLLCGFISGQEELIRWEASELFSFYHDTRPYKGTLDFLLPLITDDAIRRAVRISACGIYHSCVHNVLHEKDARILKSLYKTVAFVVRARHFIQTGKYILQKQDMLQETDEESRLLLEAAEAVGQLENIPQEIFAVFSQKLFSWAKNQILERGSCGDMA